MKGGIQFHSLLIQSGVQCVNYHKGEIFKLSMLELQLTKNYFKHGICSNIKVTNSESIFQQKAIQLSNCSNSIVQLKRKTITHGEGTKHDMQKSVYILNSF